ncbi:MAG: hypothetical protein JXN61_04975 [Sedimentisphaerales bacterium]|nr:hypothetical protein [Sedimentisphaerales bacterium]
MAKFRRETQGVLDDTISCLAEGITGLAAADKKELSLSVGHLFQALLKGRLLSQFAEEWKRLREKGRIKEDYESSEQHVACLQEMLEFLDKDVPDQVTFDFLKKIFFVAATDPDTDRESLLPHEYMRVCRRLSSGEVIVLATAFRVPKAEYARLSAGATGWLRVIADRSGLAHTGLVEVHEEELMEKKLLTPRRHSDRSGVEVGPHFRLTDLAYAICDYIEKYKEPESEEQDG